MSWRLVQGVPCPRPEIAGIGSSKTPRDPIKRDKAVTDNGFFGTSPGVTQGNPLFNVTTLWAGGNSLGQSLGKWGLTESGHKGLRERALEHFNPKCTPVLVTGHLVPVLPGSFFVSVEKSHVGFSLAAILTQIYNNRKSTQLCVVSGASRIPRWCKISQSILYEPHSDLHTGGYHPIEGVSGWERETKEGTELGSAIYVLI